jgi:Zn2+/Cd2+-exporting ATPase
MPRFTVEPEHGGWISLSTRDSSIMEMRVGGMDCASCAAHVERAIVSLSGVEDVTVDVVGGRVKVAMAQPLPRAQIAAAVRRAGYAVIDAERREHPRAWWASRGTRGRLVAATVAGVMLAAGLGLHWTGGPESVAVALLAGATIAGGWWVVPRGLRAARDRALDMNFLMTVAAVGAAIIGEWGEAASAMFLFSVAQLLETRSMERARHAISALLDLTPKEAIVLRDGMEATVPVQAVELGEVIRIRPGQRVPLDGEVVAGRSAVNEAPITGESIPVDKQAGSELFAGSINAHGMLEMRVTRHMDDTTLARVIHAVEEAQATRAPAQAFVDRFARIYTPAVVVMAVLVATLPPLLFAAEWNVWFYRALAMLVIACPCALVISTPVSIVSGLAAAARGGVLVKGGVHLERAAEVTVAAFDKTGTLTRGMARVQSVQPLDGNTEERVLAVAASVEKHSEHPLAHAVVQFARDRGIVPIPSTDFHAHFGRGATATVEAALGMVGNARMLEESPGDWGDAIRSLGRMEEEGATAVAVAHAGRLLGVIRIADEIRPEAAEAIAALHRNGIRAAMLTGDAEPVARSVARAAGIDETHARLLPEDKLAVVRAMEEAGERVAFIGDGVNDAPSLAAATVGIAMGGAANDVAFESADIVLMADDLARLPFAVRVARRTVTIIKQNIVFSLALKAVFLALALVGWATLWMAVAADTGASLLVVANGLRILRLKD